VGAPPDEFRPPIVAGDGVGWRSLLQAAEEAAPAAAVDAFASVLAERLGATQVAFLIADFSGQTLVRVADYARGSMPEDDRMALADSPHGSVVRTQQSQLAHEAGGTRLLVPVTSRGDALGVLELVLPGTPSATAVAEVEAAAHLLAYVVIANRRHTDLYEWGQRTMPMSLAAEIQRRLLPAASTCEASSFSLAGWLEPAGNVGGDTFDYSLDVDTLHVSITDAVGHDFDSAMLATLAVGSVRNSRRAGAGLVEQADHLCEALHANAESGQFVTGQLVEIDLHDGSARILNAGHPSPMLVRSHVAKPIALAVDPPFGAVRGHAYRSQALTLTPGDRIVFVTDGFLERNAAAAFVPHALVETRSLHPREAVQELARAVLEATDGKLRDDATILCLDWYGTTRAGRLVTGGADPSIASPAEDDSDRPAPQGQS
jgi:serine phosphatase RsbU (regulator of sigma subunit)